MAYMKQGTKDCVIVSICNYLGVTETDAYVAAMFANCSPRNVRDRGMRDYEVTLTLFKLTGKAWRESKPRRGQDKINGLCKWRLSRNYHMTAVVDGIVYDTDGSVSTMEEYRQKNQCHLNKVWLDYR